MRDFSVGFKRFSFAMDDDEGNLIYDDEDDSWVWEEEVPENQKSGAAEKPADNEASLEGSATRVTISGVDPEYFRDTTLNSQDAKANIWNLNSRVGRFRFNLHLVVDHIAARLFSILLVLADIVLVLIALATSADNEVHGPITLAIVSYFMFELLLRIFAWGKEFFHHRMEVVDMVIIVVSFVVTVVYEAITLNTPKYAKLVVVFRLLRILLLARICTGRKHLEKSTRNLISQNKRRYVKDGFDLDLTYITERVIAMSFPSSGKHSMYRNPIEEVSRFFNTKYPGRYKIYNLCSERSYDPRFFNDNVERVLVDDHNVPRLSQLLQFCHSVEEWMKKDPSNLVAIHCKGGKGRTGTCVAAWLLYSGQFKTAEKSLEYFGLRRTDKSKGKRFQGVETPSQSRYVGYMEKVLREMGSRVPVPKPFVFKSLKISSINRVGNGDGSDLRMEVIVNNRVIYDLNFNVPIGAKVIKKHDAVKVKFSEDECPLLSGDIKLMFHSSNPNVPRNYDDCAFFFWFHTNFIHNHKLHLSRNEIDNPHKTKTHKVFTDKFGVTLSFADPAKGRMESPSSAD